MRHKKKKIILNRVKGPRTALIRGLCLQLIEHGRITTTPVKAKAVQQFVEPLITAGKEKSVQNVRSIDRKLTDKKATLRITDTIAPKFKTRKGGYTRITKIGPRKGDGAQQVVIEFVD